MCFLLLLFVNVFLLEITKTTKTSAFVVCVLTVFSLSLFVFFPFVLFSSLLKQQNMSFCCYLFKDTNNKGGMMLFLLYFYKQTNKQTIKQTNKTNKTNKQTKQANKQTNKQTNKTNKQTKQTNEQNKQTNKQTNKQPKTNKTKQTKQTNKQTNEQNKQNKQTSKQSFSPSRLGCGGIGLVTAVIGDLAELLGCVLEKYEKTRGVRKK